MILYNEDAKDFEESYPGFHIIILDELARRAGFEWRSSWGGVFPATMYDSFRLQPNATFDELLLWTVNAYDISWTTWDGTLARLKLGITFPGGFADTSTILVTKSVDSKEETTFDPFSFLKPFNWIVWICTIVTIIFTALMYRFIQQIYDAQEQTNHGIHIFRASMAAIGQVMFEPTRHGERILVLSLSF